MYETHLFLKLLITYELWNTCSFKQNDNKLYVASTKKALQMYRFDNSPWLPSSSWRYIKICMWYSSMCLKKAVLWKKNYKSNTVIRPKIHRKSLNILWYGQSAFYVILARSTLNSLIHQLSDQQPRATLWHTGLSFTYW